ncbi:SRPBCC family protein [Streptomyces atroolivaceus]|uniref:SRPBCC family protein n=1 Tax=Streptomyces atroolivaceus TaxID=66869 RepID=A0ABV9VFP6_STRAZ|nr:SRPBCC family protein [Streptomyces atroolivaceus]
MAIRHQLINHPPSALWSVLEQPVLYGKWVVGTQDSRLLEGQWPEVGASIEYTVRLGPKELQGRTTVRRLERPGGLELEAYSGLLGTARIAFDIRPWGDGTLVLLDEHPLQGLGGILHNVALDAVLQIRHRAMLGRLAEVVDAQVADRRPAG